MMRLFFNYFRQLLTNNHTPSELLEVKDEDNIQRFTESLDSACAKFTVYIREDGEFAITSEFYRNNSEEAVDATSMILHMINSGSLADYFLKSLHLWGEDNDESEFVIEIIKRWKDLFDKNEHTIQNNLAIDPSDVFSLKSLKKDK